MSAEATCAICGRTILAGERVHGFVAGGEERPVCELCVARAERLRWRRAGDPEPERTEEGHEGRWRLRTLLRRRGHSQSAPAPSDRFEDRGSSSGENAEGDIPEPKPVSVGQRRRPSPPPDLGGASVFELAVTRFNSSEAGRTVAGLTRTLGTPSASVGAAAGAPDEVRITVAWDLSWYQWGVDLGDELRPVFELEKGREIDQIDAAARQWNAAVDGDGRLGLAGEPAAKR
ncbi:MAG: hypothetical protein ACJ76D_12790 [Solirubrobacterales bacterium]